MYYRTRQGEKEIVIELGRDNVLENWAGRKGKLFNWAGSITELGRDFVLQNWAGRKRNSYRNREGLSKN